MKNWYCIHTKPNYEEYVSRRLMNVPHVEVFNARIIRKKYVRRKLSDIIEGLFPCYIFSRFDPAKYLHLIQYTRGVRRIVGDRRGNPYVVDEGIIDQVQSRMSDGFIHPMEIDLEAGDEVIIREGPLKGFTGIFQKELKAHERVLILLNAITYQAHIEIEKGFLARA